MNVNSETDVSKGIPPIVTVLKFLTPTVCLGFAFKYCIHATKKNNLGIKYNKIATGDLRGYYDDDSWVTDGSLQAMVEGDPKVRITTDMLEGAEDQGHTYKLEVHIGS